MFGGSGEKAPKQVFPGPQETFEGNSAVRGFEKTFALLAEKIFSAPGERKRRDGLWQRTKNVANHQRERAIAPHFPGESLNPGDRAGTI